MGAVHRVDRQPSGAEMETRPERDQCGVPMGTVVVTIRA